MHIFGVGLCMTAALKENDSTIASEFPTLIELLREKYELTKQNADYISTTVDYLKVFKWNIRNISDCRK